MTREKFRVDLKQFLELWQEEPAGNEFALQGFDMGLSLLAQRLSPRAGASGRIVRALPPVAGPEGQPPGCMNSLGSIRGY
jgi:hypothetical protein